MDLKPTLATSDSESLFFSGEQDAPGPAPWALLSGHWFRTRSEEMVLFSYFPPALLRLSLLFSQAFSLFPHSHQINALSGDFAQKQPQPEEEPVASLELLLATEKKTKL